MKRYQPKTVRPAFGIASAAVLTALTLSLSVVVPVGLAPVAAATMLAAPSSAPAVRQVTISPARIDVVRRALDEPRDGEERDARIDRIILPSSRLLPQGERLRKGRTATRPALLLFGSCGGTSDALEAAGIEHRPGRLAGGRAARRLEADRERRDAAKRVVRRHGQARSARRRSPGRAQRARILALRQRPQLERAIRRNRDRADRLDGEDAAAARRRSRRGPAWRRCRPAPRRSSASVPRPPGAIRRSPSTSAAANPRNARPRQMPRLAHQDPPRAASSGLSASNDTHSVQIPAHTRPGA